MNTYANQQSYLTVDRDFNDEGMKRMGYSAVPSSVGSKKGIDSYQSQSINYKDHSEDKSRN